MFDLLYYCDSYPAIGNGHLKRAFDIINSLKRKNSSLKIALIGKYSETAKNFITKFNKHNVDIYNPYYNNLKSKLSFLDTMFNQGDVDTIDEKTCNYLKKISNKLYVFNTGFNSYVPYSVDAIINYIPITKYSGNLNFTKYFGFEYSPVSIEFVPDKNIEQNIDILCIIGGSDNQIGSEILSQNIDVFLDKNYRIVFILSPHFPKSKIDILTKQYPGITYLQNVQSIKQYLDRAKTVICTYGTATYESMMMQKPTFVVSYLDFQNKFAEYFEKKDLCVNLGYFLDINKDNLLKIKDDNFTKQLIKNCYNQFKKPGIEKISEIILRDLKNV